RFEINAGAVTKRDAAKTVPLGLVVPLTPLRERLSGLCFHRWVTLGERQAHRNVARSVRPRFSRSGVQRSPILASRRGTFIIVKSSSSTPSSTSCQLIGLETVACGLGRTEYTEASVRFHAF